MSHSSPIAAWSRRGNLPGVTGAPRLRLSGRFASLIMLAALAIRLASMMPGVPVLHWHGAIAVVHAGGGFAHGFGDGSCGGGGGEENPENDGSGDTGETYFSPLNIPAQAAEGELCLPADQLPRGLVLFPPHTWYDAGANPPGPSRGPPQR